MGADGVEGIELAASCLLLLLLLPPSMGADGAEVVEPYTEEFGLELEVGLMFAVPTGGSGRWKRLQHIEDIKAHPPIKINAHPKPEAIATFPLMSSQDSSSSMDPVASPMPPSINQAKNPRKARI